MELTEEQKKKLQDYAGKWYDTIVNECMDSDIELALKSAEVGRDGKGYVDPATIAIYGSTW